MNRKLIEKFNKESMNGKLVNYQLFDNLSLTGIGRIVYEESSENDEDFFILQNHEDGVPTDIKDPIFKYSVLYYPTDVQIWELSKEEEETFLNKIETLNKLKKGDSVFFKGNIQKISKKDSDGNAWIGSEMLTISSEFKYIENPDTFYKDMYKSLVESEYLIEEYRKDIERHIKVNARHTGSIHLKMNGIIFRFAHQGDGTLIFDGVRQNNSLYKNPNGFLDVDYDDKGRTIEESVNFLKQIFTNSTFIGNALNTVIINIECDQTIKDHLLLGNYYNNMQFVDYDESTQMISYIPKGKELVYDSNDVLTSKHRQTIKPHKFFNSVLKDVTTEYEIKCFADKLIAFFNSWTVKYFKGKKFAENYSRVNTRTWSTQSCMDRKAENFFEMYTQTPFRLGVIYREGEEVGRFIEVTTDEGFVYNDRLYYKDETVQAWYNSWCDKNKLNRKERNSQDSKENFYNVDKGVFKKKVVVTLKKKLDDIAVYPYLDTLTYGFGNKIQNFDSADVRYQFTGTGGKCSRVRCKIDIVTKRYIDDNIAVQIGFGLHKGEYTTVDRMIYSAENQGHCLK